MAHAHPIHTYRVTVEEDSRAAAAGAGAGAAEHRRFGHHTQGKLHRNWSVIVGNEKYDVSDFTSAGMKITDKDGKIVWSGARLHGGHYHTHATSLSEGKLQAVLDMVKDGDRRHQKAPPTPKTPSAPKPARAAKPPKAPEPPKAPKLRNFVAVKGRKVVGAIVAPTGAEALKMARANFDASAVMTPKAAEKMVKREIKKAAKAAKMPKAPKVAKAKAAKAPKTPKAKKGQGATAAQRVSLARGRYWHVAKARGWTEAAFQELWDKAAGDLKVVQAALPPKSKKASKAKAPKKPRAPKKAPKSKKAKAPKAPKSKSAPKSSKTAKKPKTRTPAQLAALQKGREQRLANKKSGPKSEAKSGPKSGSPKLSDAKVLEALKTKLETQGSGELYPMMEGIWKHGGKAASARWMKAKGFKDPVEAFTDWMDKNESEAIGMMGG